MYLGMARFNARGRAERFRGVELASCVRAAHDHGVKVYVTLNTLLRDDELSAGIELAAEALAEGARVYRAAVDAWAEGRSFEEEEAVRRARRVFTRGFTNGYLDGIADASMRGDKRALEGEPDAIVRWANRKKGILVLEPRPGHAIRPGQGYRYAHDRYQGGFPVLSVGPAASVAGARGSQGVAVEARFGAEARGRSHRRGASGRRRPPPLPIGLACYLNDDPELEPARIALRGKSKSRS